MKKFLTLVLTLILASSASFAAKIPDDVREYILNKVPNTDIRFDGVVILPDNTVYLPLFPSLFSDVTSLKVKTSYPENKELNQKPDVLIFNNDFVLMKVLTDSNGNKTVLHMKTPPLQVRTGLLPQDMLVPSGLVLPENIKGIIGNLKVDTKNEDVIKRNSKESYEEFFGEIDTSNDSGAIPQLKNKVLFVMTNYSKNIQVFNPFNIVPVYSLAQKSIPIDIEPVNNGKFLLVTSYQRPFVDVISVADSRFIKQINLDAFAGEILVDETANKAYVTVPTNSTICVIDLKTMSLIQKIRVNGYCEKLLKSEDKLFYVDKLKSEIWAIELAKDYELKDIGRFPNVSDMVFKNDKLFLASRTKSRVAVIDYTTLGLISEFTTVNKTYLKAINLAEKDEVIGCDVVDDEKNVMEVTSQGQVLVYKATEIPLQGRTAAGVKGIKLNDDDSVVFGGQVEEEGEIIVVSNTGYAKRVISALIEPSSRYLKGIKIIELDQSFVKYVGTVKMPYDIAFVSGGQTTIVNTENIRIDTRTTKGKQLFKQEVSLVTPINDGEEFN